MELVGAALDHKIEADTAGRLCDLLARRRDLDLLEVVVVEIRRRGAGQRHIGHHDAVDGPDRILRASSLRREVRLLARLIARDVHAVDEHSCHRPQQRERVAGGRNHCQFVGREVGGGARFLAVDNRRRGSHGDDLVDRADFQLYGEIDGFADVDDHVVAHDRGEALE